MNKQKGFAPILIVIIIAVIAVGGYLIYQNFQNQPKPTPPPQTTQTIQPSPSSTPSTSPKLTATLSPTIPVKNPSPVSKIIPTPSPSPSSSVSLSPTPKPSPALGIYQLDLKPTSDIQMSTSSQGYIASILLKDSNGDIVYDQSDFSFSAFIDNPIATISLLNGDWQECQTDKIKYDQTGYNYGLCPNYRLSIDNPKTGSAKITVKATQKSTGKIVAEGTYSLTIR